MWSRRQHNFSRILKSLLITRGQMCNRAAQKMNLFTTLAELWNYDSRNLCVRNCSFFEQLYDPPCVMAALVKIPAGFPLGIIYGLTFLVYNYQLISKFWMPSITYGVVQQSAGDRPGTHQGSSGKYSIVASTNTCYYSENQVFGGVTIRVLCSKRGCY